MAKRKPKDEAQTQTQSVPEPVELSPGSRRSCPIPLIPLPLGPVLVLETILLHPGEIVVDEELNSRDSTGLVDDMAASLLEHGQEVPIRVRRQDGIYHLVEGYRRHKAAVAINDGPAGDALGGFRLRAEVVECSDAQAFMSNVIENNLRKDLGVVEKARAMDRLVNEFGLPQSVVAKSMGVSRSAVNKHLKLLEDGAVPRGVLKALGQGKTTMDAVLAVLYEPEAARAGQFETLLEVVSEGAKATREATREATAKKTRGKAKAEGEQPESRALTLKELKVFWAGVLDDELPEGADVTQQVVADWILKHAEGRIGPRKMRANLAGLRMGR